MDNYINNNFSLCQQLLKWDQTAKSFIQMMAMGDQSKSFKSFKKPYCTGRDYIRGNSGKNLSLQRVKWEIRTVKVRLIGVSNINVSFFGERKYFFLISECL